MLASCLWLTYLASASCDLRVHRTEGAQWKRRKVGAVGHELSITDQPGYNELSRIWLGLIARVLCMTGSCCSSCCRERVLLAGNHPPAWLVSRKSYSITYWLVDVATPGGIGRPCQSCTHAIARAHCIRLCVQPNTCEHGPATGSAFGWYVTVHVHEADVACPHCVSTTQCPAACALQEVPKLSVTCHAGVRACSRLCGSGLARSGQAAS